MITWRFMETAPKGKGQILGLCQSMTRAMGAPLTVAHLLHWIPGGHCIEDHPPIEAGWYRWNGCQFVPEKPYAWAPYNAPSFESDAPVVTKGF